MNETSKHEYTEDQIKKIEKSRQETESVVIVEKFESDHIVRPNNFKRRNRNNGVTITIDPKPKSESNRIQI